jgi:L-seryl-tRNA(Ser) seleniumtransferase
MVNLSALPSVEQILQSAPAIELIAAYGRPLTLAAIRGVLEDIRQQAATGGAAALPGQADLLERVRGRLEAAVQPTLLPVINASGVILHTNLGRAPLSGASLQAMETVSRAYSNLEYDLEKGKRGSRLTHAEAVLKELTGVEAALVVNNNASALLLALSALARRRRVVIARSQLVEIGGGFRVPEVMKQSGARLLEVGTTNKVRLSDYEEALAEPVALVMRAHRSNFKIIGFTEEPDLKDIVAAAHAHNLPVIDDLGSGALLETERFGLGHEPTVQESLAAGVDLVCFSGDKLLGGPQAGIIIGRKSLVDKLKKHPLARAIRADKTCLAGLTATLLHYLKDEAEREIPIWRMIALDQQQIKLRAQAWADELGQGQVVPGESTVGGGSLPEEVLPTSLLALYVAHTDRFLGKLRQGQPPVIARTENDRILFDPRTVLPGQERALLAAIRKALKKV